MENILISEKLKIRKRFIFRKVQNRIRLYFEKVKKLTKF